MKPRGFKRPRVRNKLRRGGGCRGGPSTMRRDEWDVWRKGTHISSRNLGDAFTKFQFGLGAVVLVRFLV